MSLLVKIAVFFLNVKMIKARGPPDPSAGPFGTPRARDSGGNCPPPPLNTGPVLLSNQWSLDNRMYKSFPFCISLCNIRPGVGTHNIQSDTDTISHVATHKLHSSWAHALLKWYYNWHILRQSRVRTIHLPFQIQYFISGADMRFLSLCRFVYKSCMFNNAALKSKNTHFNGLP